MLDVALLFLFTAPSPRITFEPKGGHLYNHLNDYFVLIVLLQYSLNIPEDESCLSRTWRGAGTVDKCHKMKRTKVFKVSKENWQVIQGRKTKIYSLSLLNAPFMMSHPIIGCIFLKPCHSMQLLPDLVFRFACVSTQRLRRVETFDSVQSFWEDNHLWTWPYSDITIAIAVAVVLHCREGERK